MFIFDGGTMTEGQVASIKLQDGELAAFELCAEEEAAQHIGPDLPLRPVGHFLDLVHEPVDQPRPDRLRQRIPASLTDRDVPGDRLRVAPGQLRGQPSGRCGD